MNPRSIHAGTYWDAAVKAHGLDLANPPIERAQRDSICRKIEVFTAGQQIPDRNLRHRNGRRLFGESRNTRIGLRHGSTNDRLAQRRAALTKTSGPTDFWVLAAESIGVLGSELANIETPDPAIESARALPDPR